MFKVIATDVVISKGYDGAPALKFSENGESVRFRIGKKVYDTRAENNTRWVNLSVKAFGPVCERIKKMQLKESSFINILGRLDEDVWEDSTTHEKRSAMVVILDEIGRGTSTFDGLSIAWAVAEYLLDHPSCRARTQFATHYHELSALPHPQSLPPTERCQVISPALNPSAA